MWQKGWRNEIWQRLENKADPWDLLIIGGGITGAGILREATRLGLKALLVDQRDFAWGTSSRSSKLVHGGLRYMQEGKLGLTRASVHERQQLLSEGPGLIDPLGFLLTIYEGDFPGRWVYGVGLSVYDLMALRWDHKYYSSEDFRMLAPHVARRNLKGGFRFGDAQTDDARLVLRVIREAVAEGGTALNYTRAGRLLRAGGEEVAGQDGAGLRVAGAQLEDLVDRRKVEVRARVVVNATGAWADRLRSQVGAPARIRPLRGSHLIFSCWRFPLAQAVSFLHPLDNRPVFIFPWEGITLVGTTDRDHSAPLDDEPGISPEEVAYLMAAVESEFPSLGLTLDDIVSTYAGVRPVVGSGKADPSRESREHMVWEEDGLLTVTGGKLTTFRLIALDVLKRAGRYLPGLPEMDHSMPVLNRVDLDQLAQADPEGLIGSLEEQVRRRLLGRYAADAPAFVKTAREGELEAIPGTPVLWAELRWAARDEGVVHLDDLLLRRVRLGLLLPQGGKAVMPAIRSICQPELGWDDARWEAEAAAYEQLIERCYRLPARELVPDWKARLAERSRLQQEQRPIRRRKLVRRSAAAGSFIALAFALLVWMRRQFQA
ncbi:MAG: glycerol-3-phosphate dehydrogenase/oxidase [Omnitrophica WOR_2 bacterium]